MSFLWEEILNLYADLVAIKASLGISGTSDDDRLLALLESASRIIDNEAGRHDSFWNLSSILFSFHSFPLLP